jgi:hypothetical protein
MGDHPVNLGVCFSDRQLFYAINQPGETLSLTRIGKIDFNFDVHPSMLHRDAVHYPGLLDATDRLIRQYQVSEMRCLFPATNESWTALPKSVYDQPSEREAYLKILKHGDSRQQLEPYWFELSNRDFRFLTVRNKLQSEGYKQLGDLCSRSDLSSEFEIALKWVRQTQNSGSFQIIGCYSDHITVTSCVMGKLRAATYLRFPYVEDLSYLWMQSAQTLSWLNGVHDAIYMYGTNCYLVHEVLQNHFDKNTRIVRFGTLREMSLQAPEETYGFNLEEAFPAIVLSL